VIGALPCPEVVAVADLIERPIYVDIDDGRRLQIGTLTVIPDIDATVTLDPTALVTARTTIHATED
jgi:hypothetical protein